MERTRTSLLRSDDYGWIPRKKSKPRKKLFGEDDFKFFIFMSIFIFCLAGMVLIIAGLYLRPGPGRYQHFAGEDYQAISIFIIALGFCILPASLLGIYGVFNDIISIIYLYFFFLFCVIVAQAAVSFGAVSVRLSLGDIVSSTMSFGMKEYFLEDKLSYGETWDRVQESKLCCGITNYTDWPSLIPDSCYSNNTVYTRGCLSVVTTDILGDIYTILGSCVSFVILEIFAIAVIVGTS